MPEVSNAAIDTISMEPHTCPACKITFVSKPMYMHHAKYSTTCTPEDRFWGRIDKSGRCWIFQGATDKWGYGHVGLAGKRVQAHRYAFQIAKGEIPAGLLVLHKCDTPLCVRPDHLFLGTDADNVADCMAKGRFAVGERSRSNTLTEDQVRYIKANYRRTGTRKGNGCALARQMGISPGMVHRIARGQSWKHVK